MSHAPPAPAPAARPFVCRAAVVDLDGTLLDTEPLYYASYARVAGEFGKSYSFDGVHRFLLGRAEAEGAANMARILALPLTPQDVLDRRDAHLVPLFSSTAALPGAVAGMAALAGALGVARMAIATSSCRRYLELKRTGNDALFASFGAVVCGDDAAVGGRSKPDPAIFLAGAAATGVPPEECVAFEDSLAGIRSARAAGMFVVAIPDPRLSAEEVAAAGPHLVLPSLEAFTLAMVGL